MYSWVLERWHLEGYWCCVADEREAYQHAQHDHATFYQQPHIALQRLSSDTTSLHLLGQTPAAPILQLSQPLHMSKGAELSLYTLKPHERLQAIGWIDHIPSVPTPLESWIKRLEALLHSPLSQHCLPTPTRLGSHLLYPNTPRGPTLSAHETLYWAKKTLGLCPHTWRFILRQSL